jgi:hypothetical protein
MFLIKPPFFPRHLTALLNYGQINKKEAYREKAHRAKGEGDPKTIAEKIDSQEGNARNHSCKNFRIAW